MTKKILFLGCSNLVNDKQRKNRALIKTKEQIFKDVVFGEDVEIENLSWWGVGNQFIRGNCIDYITDNKVDYVYAQFTGLTRFDIPAHDNYAIPKYMFCTKTYKRRYLCSGGKLGSWIGSDRTNEIFLPCYFNRSECEHVVKESIQSVASTLWFLKEKNIPHNWTFFYDITNPATPDKLNWSDGQVEKFPDILDKTHWINSDPHSYCAKHNGLQDDHTHFDNDVYRDWVTSIKDQMNYDR